MFIFFLLLSIAIIKISFADEDLPGNWRPRDIIDNFTTIGGESYIDILDPYNHTTSEEKKEIFNSLQKLKDKGSYPFVIIIEDINEDYSGEVEFKEFIEELSFLITPDGQKHSKVILKRTTY